MTDTAQSAPQFPPQASPPSGRGLKIAFAISVALNLAVVGLIFGAWLHGGGPWRGMGHDLSFGPFSEALNADDRHAIGRAILADRATLRAGREAAKAEFDTLLSALRADPFDPVALDGALSAIVARNAGRLQKGQDLLQARITELSIPDRRAFADRLEAALKHGPRD